MADTPINITIIMATYNRAHFIEETLNSIVNQTYSNWECIIIDDGSTDKTPEVIESYLTRDSRFRYYERPEKYKKGLPGCRNYGIDLAQGQYLIFFDDDDIVHPKNLEISIKILKQEQCYFCRYDKFPFTGKWSEDLITPLRSLHPSWYYTQEIQNMVIGEIPFASCCVMWDKKCFEDQRFNEDLMYAEEWECYSRILAAGFEGMSIDEVLYYNRKHSNSNTGEFRNDDPIRIDSKIKAAILIVENLALKSLLDRTLKKFFLRMGFELKSQEIIKTTLDKSQAGLQEKMKYRLGFFLYPILRPAFQLKGKIKLLFKISMIR